MSLGVSRLQDTQHFFPVTFSLELWILIMGLFKTLLDVFVSTGKDVLPLALDS